MTTTVDLENGPAKEAPARLTLRLAALVLSNGGGLPHEIVLAYAEHVRTGAKKPAKMVSDAMRPLVRDGVIVRHEGDWCAPNLADLAAWIADGYEYREQAGHLDSPSVPAAIPAPRGSGRAAA